MILTFYDKDWLILTLSNHSSCTLFLQPVYSVTVLFIRGTPRCVVHSLLTLVMDYLHVISAIIKVISHRFKVRLRATSRMRRSKVERCKKIFFSCCDHLWFKRRKKTDYIKQNPQNIFTIWTSEAQNITKMNDITSQGPDVLLEMIPILDIK